MAKTKVAASKVATVMHEFKTGKLHSGSAKGPKVTNSKQAIAIALSEAGAQRSPRSGGSVATGRK